MKRELLTVGIAVALACSLPGAAWALASDRDQPMNIEADAMRHDENTQETVFTGRVHLTKGSIVLRGDTLTVRQREDGSQFGTAQGSAQQRAFFSQQRDTPVGAPVETVEAEAIRIEYDSATDRVRLIDNAVLRRYLAGRLNDEITGAEVVYNSRTGVFTVDGAAAAGAKSGRVRAVIGTSSTGAGGAAPSTGGASLTPSPTLQEP
ncbi:hypothetical protein AAV94_14200 [Lampropedia cohaerens]|uniref:Lipopolysaccharide export system protein LptA n=1 Tax=Lampropedia cohaerens TaxID=1610491 RepID=A0A0U1PWM8_9BURK|nr:lipopolysaccharide transport periplasmic protein LptA [Lampropedia cohaerens]KKW66919.1 hypothetical protein AAV94_14200 [Lampropedia cohaerens]